MNLKGASLVATGVVILALAWLLTRHALFAPRPLLILMQVLAVLPMAWARVTFGFGVLVARAAVP